MDSKLRETLLGCIEDAIPKTFNGYPIGYICYSFLSGSRAYGIHDEDSDYDVVCIFVAPRRFYLGLNLHEIPQAIELKEVKFVYEGIECLAGIRYYELKHFIRLALKNNPSILEGLWIDDLDIIHHGHTFQDFRRARTLFISSTKIFKAYTGYAYDQMKKMTSPDGPTGRMGAKRKELLEKFGYDTKNAAHLIRMLYTAVDIAKNSEIRVKMPEHTDMLKKIKQGKFTLDEILFMAADLGDLAERTMHERETTGKILKSDNEAIDDILIKRLWEALT